MNAQNASSVHTLSVLNYGMHCIERERKNSISNEMV